MKYNIDFDKTMTQFLSLCELMPEDAQSVTPIVMQAICEVSDKINSSADLTLPENQAKLETLAAIIAMYKYILMELCRQPKQVKMFDVTITNSDQNSLALVEQMKNDAMISAKNLINDDGFCFIAR